MDETRAWITLGIAIVALSQPLGIYLWARYLRQGQIDIFETANVEVGFVGIGATIALQGTLRAVHQDQFVTSIKLRMVRLKDNAERSFDWVMFRAQKVTAGTAQELEVPAGFMMTTQSPRRYNIQFVDLDSQNEMRPHLARLQEGWKQQFAQLNLGNLVGTTNYQPAVSAAFAEFATEPLFVEVYGALQRLCYWEPGRYSLEMNVATSRPSRTFSRTWGFTLTDERCQALRLNSIEVAQAACGQGAGYYNWEFPAYETVVGQ